MPEVVVLKRHLPLRTMLMDFIQGPDAEKIFEALRKCLDDRKISHEKYWEAIQFIARCLLDVTGHIAGAEVVHSDIKPENIIVNEETGEPVLIDLEVCSKAGKRPRDGSLEFIAPEIDNLQRVDERSDVFAVGVLLWRGIEGPKGLSVEDFLELQRKRKGTRQKMIPLKPRI